MAKGQLIIAETRGSADKLVWFGSLNEQAKSWGNGVHGDTFHMA